MKEPFWKQEKAEEDLEPLLSKVKAHQPELLERFPRDVHRIMAVALPTLVVRYQEGLTGKVVRETLGEQFGVKCEYLEDDLPLSGLTFASDCLVVVLVDTQHGPEAARFTLAHEAGHLATEFMPRLEKDKLGNARVVMVDTAESVTMSGRPVSKRETVANACAAALLAPMDEVRKLFPDEPREDAVERVQTRFGLSRVAATIRLMELGLIPQARIQGQAPL